MSQNAISNKQCTLLLFLILWLTSRAPYWIAYMAEWPTYAEMISAVLSMSLAIILPLIADAKWYKYASFDKTVLPSTNKQYFLIPPAVVLIITWSSLVGFVLHRLGYTRTIVVSMSATLVAVNWAIVIVLAPLAEEIFWRGYALDQFSKTMNKPAACLLCAIIFTLSHLPTLGVYSIAVLGVGVVLGYYRIRYRALLPMVLSHILANGIVVLAALTSNL